MTKHDKFYTQIILDAIDVEFDEVATDKEKVAYAWDRFQSEVGKWRTPQAGELTALKDWFQGLALNVPYVNYEILTLAKEAGILAENASERKECNFIETYWNRLGPTLRRMQSGHIKLEG